MKASKYVYILIALNFLLLFVMPFKICQFFLITSFSVFVMSALYAWSLKNNIKAVRNISQLKLACKEKAEISFTLKNYSKLPAFMLYFFDNAPFFYIYGQENKGLIGLRSLEVKKVSYFVSMQDRGKYQIGPVSIKTSDPLGLFYVDIELAANIDVVVRPARIKLITETVPGFPQGQLKIDNVCYEDITMRRSIREYKNGDELKRINWRASARFGNLYTNQYEDSYDAPFFVFLNLAEDDYDLHDLRYHSEKAIEIAASIVEKARYFRQRVGFAAYGSGMPYLPPQRNQVDSILDVLSTIQIEKGHLNYNPEKVFKRQMPAGTLIFVIGPDEVINYFGKVDENKQDINTENVGIMRNKNGRKNRNKQ